MGIFDFLKNAGRKVDEDNEPATKSPAPDANQVREKFEETRERAREASLLKLINSMGFQLQNLVVNVEKDTVTLSGTAQSQEEREKVVLLVGNTQGIARVDDRLAVGNTRTAAGPSGGATAPGTVLASTGGDGESQAQFYTVESGDSLSKIAKQYYGNANQYMKIFEANKPMLKDPDEIYPGQVLRIPGASAAKTGAAPSGARA